MGTGAERWERGLKASSCRQGLGTSDARRTKASLSFATLKAKTVISSCEFCNKMRPWRLATRMRSTPLPHAPQPALEALGRLICAGLYRHLPAALGIPAPWRSHTLAKRGYSRHFSGPKTSQCLLASQTQESQVQTHTSQDTQTWVLGNRKFHETSLYPISRTH